MSVSLSLPRMHCKKVFLFYAATLVTGSTCYFSSTHSAMPHTWAIIQDGRLLTKTCRAFTRRVFNQVNTVCKIKSNSIITCELSLPHLDLQSLHQRRDPPCCLHLSLRGPGLLGLPQM